MVISNSSSSSMTSSTMSSESAPTSSWNEVCRVTCSLFTPRFSQTISMTRSSTEATVGTSQLDHKRQFRKDIRRPPRNRPFRLYVPQGAFAGQGGFVRRGNLGKMYFGPRGRKLTRYRPLGRKKRPQGRREGERPENRIALAPGSETLPYAPKF